LFANKKLDLSQFFLRLEKEASKLNISLMQMSPREKIFEKIFTSEFKNMGNKYLKNLKIALLPRVTIIDGKNQIEINKILKKFHDNPITGGHTGITRTLSKVKKYYFWKGMTKHITKYVKACENCQISKITKHNKPPAIITPTPISAFEIVLVDTVGPLPKTENGNEYAVTIICDLSKYLITVPIPNKNAKTVAKAIIDSCILVYGPMKKFISDLGTEYTVRHKILITF